MNWNQEMEKFVEENSDHFIDRYNREIVYQEINGQKLLLDIGNSNHKFLMELTDKFRHLITAVCQDIFHTACFPYTPDIITCLNVLEHIDNDIEAIKEIYKRVAPGGKAIFTVPMGPHLYDVLDIQHFHCRRYTWDELKWKVSYAGFKIERMNYFGVLPYPAFYLQKRLNQVLYKDPDMKVLRNQTKKSKMSWLMPLCRMEYKLGKRFRYPFGIRCYVVARKDK